MERTGERSVGSTGSLRRGRAAAVVLVLLAGCSGGNSSGSDAGGPTPRPSTTSAPSDVPPGGERLVPVEALGPAAGRWTYLASRPTITVVAPDPAAESAAMADRRALVDARRPSLADDRFTRVEEATPTRFAELAVDVVRRRALNPLRASRLLAAVAVAAHEGATAALRTPLPGGPTPVATDAALGAPLRAVDAAGVERPVGVLPPELVAAAAQQTVACDLQPEECPRFERLGTVARDRALGTGAYWPSTLDAAWSLGSSAGRAVLDRVAADGARPWIGDDAPLPDGATWRPTPGLFAPALEPGAGTWRPWNLAAGDVLRPGPPPAPGSAGFDDALAQVADEGTNLGDRALRVVRFWDLGPGTSTPPGYWVADVAADALRRAPTADQASVLALLATAELDAGVATWDAKYRYGLVRPVTELARTRPGWLPSLPTPPFPAYTSGHSAFAAAAAAVMAVAVPSRAEEFYDAAAEASDSRVAGGIHYWFDTVEGLRVGLGAATASLARAGLRPDPDLEPVEERVIYASASARTRGRR